MVNEQESVSEQCVEDEEKQEFVKVEDVVKFLTTDVLVKVIGATNLIRDGKEILTADKLRSLHDKIVLYITSLTGEPCKVSGKHCDESDCDREI